MSQHFHGVALKDTGVPANGATVNILEKGTVNLLTIYSDEDCTLSIVNPLTTDTYGRYDFYLKNEIECDIEISGTGITTYKLEDVDAGIAEEIPATYVIYKKGSTYYAQPSHSSGLANYNGADAAAVILAAIDAINVGGIGGKIYISEGTYATASTIILQNNIAVIGAGIGRTIIKPSVAGDVFYATGKTYLALSEMEIDSSGVLVDPAVPIAIYSSIDIKVENVYAHDVAGAAAGYGMYFEDCEILRIINPKTKSTGRDGIQLKGCYHNWIVNPYVESAGYYGIDCHNSVAPRDMEDTHIINPIILGCQRGIDINQGGYWEIVNPIIKDTTYNALDLRATLGKVIIDNPQIYNSGLAHLNTYDAVAITDLIINSGIFDTTTGVNTDGLFLKNITNGAINNTIVKGATRYGFYLLSSVKINNCLSKDNGGIGIEIEVDDCEIENCKITGNTGWGIREYTAHNNNVIRNNVVTGNTSGQITYVGADTVVKGNVGYVTEKSDTKTVSGNAVLTSFNVAHGLAAIPTKVHVSRK